MNDDFTQDWLANYDSRALLHGPAAQEIRAEQATTQQELEQDQWVPSSTLWQRINGEEVPSDLPDIKGEPVATEAQPRSLGDRVLDVLNPGWDRDATMTQHLQQLVGDVARPLMDGNPVAGGVRDAAQGVLDLGAEIDQSMPDSLSHFKQSGEQPLKLPEVGGQQDEGLAAGLSRGLTQAMAGFAAGGGFKQGAGWASRMAAGGFADALFDPQDGDLSTFLKEVNVDNALVDFLDSRVEGDASAEERLQARAKTVLEGAGLGLLADFAVDALKAARGTDWEQLLRRGAGAQAATEGAK